MLLAQHGREVNEPVGSRHAIDKQRAAWWQHRLDSANDRTERADVTGQRRERTRQRARVGSPLALGIFGEEATARRARCQGRADGVVFRLIRRRIGRSIRQGQRIGRHRRTGEVD